MPLKPATTRDCGGGVQFNAVTTGTFTTQRAAAVSSSSARQVRVGIRKRAKSL